MPVIFRDLGFKFFFYSNEGSPREPVHVHVEKDEHEAKFWLLPEIRVAYNDGYDARTLRELLEIVAARAFTLHVHTRTTKPAVAFCQEKPHLATFTSTD